MQKFIFTMYLEDYTFRKPFYFELAEKLRQEFPGNPYGILFCQLYEGAGKSDKVSQIPCTKNLNFHCMILIMYLLSVFQQPLLTSVL